MEEKRGKQRKINCMFIWYRRRRKKI